MQITTLQAIDIEFEGHTPNSETSINDMPELVTEVSRFHFFYLCCAYFQLITEIQCIRNYPVFAMKNLNRIKKKHK